MSADLIWSDQAKDDLDAILEYINLESPTSARRYVEGLVIGCDKLRTFPAIGRAFNSKYRVLVYRNHLIFYDFIEATNEIVVAKVIDGRSDYGRTFEALLKD